MEQVTRCKGCGAWVYKVDYCAGCIKINAPTERRSSNADTNQGGAMVTASKGANGVA